VKQLARLLGSRGGGAILCLHAVKTPEWPTESASSVTLEQLDAMVKVLSSIADIVSIRELVARQADQRSTRRLAAITFDDAYASLAVAVHEVFRPRSTPISVFVISNAAHSGARFWWDRVEDAAPHLTPGRLRQLESAIGIPEQFRTGQPSTYGPLRPLRQWIMYRYRGAWPSELESALDELEKDAGICSRQRSMTYPEMRALAGDDGCVEFGVHTASHRVLPLLSREEALLEIEGCHRALMTELPAVAPILAIPFGLFDQRTATIARDAGMVASLSLAGTPVPNNSRTLEILPRLSVSARTQLWRLQLQVLGVEQRARTWMGRQFSAYPELPSAKS
jgi:peptidoglycan/xylan/chitin deacetylase (PgdA/CDA1 family)